MPSDFRGATARHYARYRRDVPGPVVDQLIERFQLRPGDRVLDLGAGTGQLSLPLARALGGGLAVDPEPDMLAELRERARAAELPLLCLLGADKDLGAVADLVGEGALAMLTVANALHWMDAGLVAAQACRLLRPGGGLAVITHGRPQWLGDRPWARSMRDYLQKWWGRSLTDTCGTDEDTLITRQKLLLTAGFTDVAILRHEYRVSCTPESVLGLLYSAMSKTQVDPEFERGLRSVLAGYPDLVEDVPVTSLVATRP